RAPSETPIAAYRIRVTPSISLSTLTAQRLDATTPGTPPTVEFRASAHGSYNELIAADSKYSSDVSKHRHFDGGADFVANFLPTKPIGFDVYADYLRVVQPSNDINAENSFDRDTFRGGAGVSWRPGGGLFDWRIGYELVYNYFESDPYKLFNNAQHNIKT